MNAQTILKYAGFVVGALAITLVVAKIMEPKSVTPLAVVQYSCNAGKTIDAEYYAGQTKPATGDQPPIPGGSVDLKLSDGRTMTLTQTISADGARYANPDESFVFWNKGNGALVLENNQEKSYVGCIAVAPAAADLPQVYSNNSFGFSLRLPAGFSIDEAYKYQALGQGKDIAGIKFTIPESMATGTNLSRDSYVSVEEIPQSAVCNASLFVSSGTKVADLLDGIATYSFASSTDAGAGNRYEESVFALPGTNPCVAVRYFIHYGAIENYPVGLVREFDKQSLLNTFDQIRRTLVINQ